MREREMEGEAAGKGERAQSSPRNAGKLQTVGGSQMRLLLGIYVGRFFLGVPDSQYCAVLMAQFRRYSKWRSEVVSWSRDVLKIFPSPLSANALDVLRRVDRRPDTGGTGS
jgi:hypothetical protein